MRARSEKLFFGKHNFLSSDTGLRLSRSLHNLTTRETVQVIIEFYFYRLQISWVGQGEIVEGQMKANWKSDFSSEQLNLQHTRTHFEGFGIRCCRDTCFISARFDIICLETSYCFGLNVKCFSRRAPKNKPYHLIKCLKITFGD